MRQRVSPEDFIQFKQQSALFMRGEASAPAFHSQVVALGLAALLPDLAALCHDAVKRSDLLDAHRAAFINEGSTKVRHSALACVRWCIASWHSTWAPPRCVIQILLA